MRIMGLDIGTKVTGIALSDEGKIIASSRPGLTGYKNMKELGIMVMDEMKKYALESVVVGRPVHMSGEDSHFFSEIEELGEELKRQTHIPVIYWDERLSTQAVERTMIEADLSRRKRKKKIDSASAQWILQGYLDYLKENEK